MNTQNLKTKGVLFILTSILMVTFGTQSISYAQEENPTITASVEAPLTEATLDGSVVTLTLNGRTYARSIFDIRDTTSVSGIDGVTINFRLNPLVAVLTAETCGRESLETQVCEKIELEAFQSVLPQLLTRLSEKERQPPSPAFGTR